MAAPWYGPSGHQNAVKLCLGACAFGYGLEAHLWLQIQCLTEVEHTVGDPKEEVRALQMRRCAPLDRKPEYYFFEFFSRSKMQFCLGLNPDPLWHQKKQWTLKQPVNIQTKCWQGSPKVSGPVVLSGVGIPIAQSPILFREASTPIKRQKKTKQIHNQT